MNGNGHFVDERPYKWSRRWGGDAADPPVGTTVGLGGGMVEVYLGTASGRSRSRDPSTDSARRRALRRASVESLYQQVDDQRQQERDGERDQEAPRPAAIDTRPTASEFSASEHRVVPSAAPGRRSKRQARRQGPKAGTHSCGCAASGRG